MVKYIDIRKGLCGSAMKLINIEVIDGRIGTENMWGLMNIIVVVLLRTRCSISTKINNVIITFTSLSLRDENGWLLHRSNWTRAPPY